MAENPATWGLAEKTISEAMTASRQQQRMGIYGASIPRAIADALRDKGLLIPDDVPEQDTSECLYGCKAPSACSYQHHGCAHCRRHRAAEPGPSHQHRSKHSYFCNVCVQQVWEGADHRCPGGNW